MLREWSPAGPVVLVGRKIPQVGSCREVRQGVWGRGRVFVLLDVREETGSWDGLLGRPGR